MSLLNQDQNTQRNVLVQQEYSEIPMPWDGESPTAFADRIGEWYVAKRSEKQRKEHGLFLTPVTAANFMADSIASMTGTVCVLDPAAGAGVLCCAAVEALIARGERPLVIRLVAYEVDVELTAPLGVVLDHLAEWCVNRYGVKVDVSIKAVDFILANASVLQPPGLFSTQLENERFDVVIANPPYFKICKDDPRAVATSVVVYGQPNIYALFMAVGAAVLREHGIFVYITPRSFTSGPYFQRFRDVFFKMIQLTSVHVFDSRRSAFRRDAVLQENVILTGQRETGWRETETAKHLKLTSSSGVDDIDSLRTRYVPLGKVLNHNSLDMVLRLPTCENEENILSLVDSWSSSLGEQGLRISTGPVMPFRATQFVSKDGDIPTSHVPLLWMNHVRAMQTRWPIERHKPEYIVRAGAERLLVPNRNYVLIRRFSSKEERRRLIAAPYIASEFPVPAIGLENHLNYIHRPWGELSVDEAWGLAALYNSHLLDTWFRSINGNTQVGATELRTMPLPGHEAILALGQSVRRMGSDISGLDSLISRMFVPPNRREVVVG